MNRKSLLSALCLLAGSTLIAVGWWDYEYPNQINQWWAGERIYPFYWQRLAVTLVVTLPLAGLAWRLGVAARATFTGVSLAQRRRHAAWGFAAGLAIPIVLALKYQVTWLGINYGSSVWTYALILVLSIVIVWQVWPAFGRQPLQEWLDRQGPMIILTSMLIFVVVYGGLSIARHPSFRTYALDLGTMDQAVWNTSRGYPLEYTPLQTTSGEPLPDPSPQSRLMGGQMELILFPLSLLYWVWPDPRLLIAIQAILLSSGAIPLYHLARTRAQDSRAALIITLAYLLYLPLHYIALADFHSSALMIPFLLWAWHAVEHRHWHTYYLAIGLALLCRIDAALALLGIGTYLLLRGILRPGNSEWRLHGGTTALLGLTWAALDFGLVSPWARSVYGPISGDWLAQQTESLPGLARELLNHPPGLVRTLLDRESLQAMFDLLAVVGGMPLLAPLILLASLPALALNLLTVSSGHNPIVAHYFAPVVPFLFVAIVWGATHAGPRIARLSRRRERSGLSPGEGSRLMVLFALATTLLAGLLLSQLPPGLQFSPAHYYQVSPHEEVLARTLELVPADAVAAAQTGLFPHLSRRRVIYLFPTIADAEYIALDLDHGANKAPMEEGAYNSTVDGLLADPSFHVVAFDNGALLLKRGPGQNPPAFADNLAEYRAGLYRSALVEYRGPTRLQADNMAQASVVLENRGTQSWDSLGSSPIYLSYHWWTKDGEMVSWDGLRNPLGQAIKPGDTFRSPAHFVTPPEPGDYVLEWDMVHENRAWFGERGGITLRVGVRVD